MKTFIAFIFISVILLSAFSPDEASSILAKIDQAQQTIKDKMANVEMQMINLKSGSKKIKKANFYQKGLNHKLFKYTYPKSDEGIATLTIPGAVYLYLPMFKKPKKVTNMAEGNAFNKSDFSLEDMNSKSYTELYTAAKLKDKDGNLVLDLKPKNSESSYSHIVAQFNKQYYYPVKFEYYDKKGKKLKVALYHHSKINGLWVVDKINMTNVKKNHRTLFIMTNIKINTGLSDDLFTVEKMVE
jgi:outer membrane lipoprotein-sorting protein